MVIVDIDEETHKQLWKYKIDQRAKTHNEAIKRLLENAEQRSQAKSD